MRVLVCGGRNFNDENYLIEALHILGMRIPLSAIIQGGARGADLLAKHFAHEYGIPAFEFRAQWKQYGKAAGHIRNKRMLEEGSPDMVLAFPGGPGTANMIAQARAADVPVIELDGSSLSPVVRLRAHTISWRCMETN